MECMNNVAALWQLYEAHKHGSRGIPIYNLYKPIWNKNVTEEMVTKLFEKCAVLKNYVLNNALRKTRVKSQF